ncbi:MAG TPA: glycosyltransferase family 1 protein [Candidatus Dormibacteraeota bacterium]
MPTVAIVDDSGVMTGIGTFMRSLVGALLEHPASAAWQVRLVLPERDIAGNEVSWPEGLRSAGLAVERIPDQPPAGVAAWLEDRLGAGGCDVAYFVSPDRLPALATRVPLVATFHDFNYRRFVTLPRPMRARLEHELLLWAERAAVCVVSSRFIAGEMASYFPAAAAKLRVVRLGIPPAAEPAPAPSAELPRRFVLTVGWLAAHKNQAPIFEALALLRRRGREEALVCVGPNSRQLQDPAPAQDSYVSELRDLARRHDLQPGRDFYGAGSVSDAELAALYRAADALVVPSLYEAGSFPLREAAQAGCPVVCSDVPPLVEDSKLLGGSALLFDPDDPASIADALEATLTRPAETAARVERALELCGQVFDWRRTASGYLAAFARALEAAA